MEVVGEGGQSGVVPLGIRTTKITSTWENW